MGRVLRQARLYDDARRANLRADRGSGVALLRRAPAPGGRLSLHCGTAARAAAARVAGARAQPIAGAAYSPPSRAVPVGLQPLQGAGGCPAAGGPVKGGARLADPNCRRRRLDTALPAARPARSDRLRSRFAAVYPRARAAQGLSYQSFALLAGDRGKGACRTRQSTLPRLRPQRPRALDSVVGIARARDAARENLRTRARRRAQGAAAHPARAALCRL